MSTFVFHHGSLGDGVLIWPLLRALAPLHLVTSGEQGQLAATALKHIEPIDAQHPDLVRLFGPEAALPVDPTRRKAFASATRLISFVSNGQDAWAKNIHRWAPQAKLWTAPTRPPQALDTPVTQHIASHLNHTGLSIEPTDPPPIQNPHGPVLLHPGSGGADKCWPLEHYRELAHRLMDLGLEVHWIIGPVERERRGQAMDCLATHFVVIEPKRLTALHTTLSTARLLITNDCGPGHLAAQLGLPTLSLFGPTAPRTWAPRGPSVTILAPEHPEPMSWLNVETVWKAAVALGLGKTSPNGTDTISPSREDQ